jgi:lipopolysaccharide transport system permease protein
MRSVTKTIHIDSESASRGTGLRELWAYRELFYFFAWRDIKVRYKQTAIGAGWAILQPFLATGVFTLFFNKVAGIDSGNALVPYAVFAYLGLMYWNCFSSALNSISNSLVNNQGVITKIYFPRIIPPLSAAALSIVDFFAAGLAFIVILFIFNTTPHLLGLVLFLPMLALLVLFALGIGSFFAALNVKYRDIRAALPFITQLMMFLTPVIYPVTLVPEQFRLLMFINPMAGVISTVRSSVFGTEINWIGLGISSISAVIVFILGMIIFRKLEKGFADVI